LPFFVAAVLVNTKRRNPNSAVPNEERMVDRSIDRGMTGVGIIDDHHDAAAMETGWTRHTKK
jgi:hypothetical protein